MIIAIYIGLVGLCLGSFVNALVWRLHEQSKPKKKRAATSKKLSITKGRSMCPHCKHELGVVDLMPVLSWLSLGGHCRYCKKPISWQYPLVELATAALFVVAYQEWGINSFQASIWQSGMLLIFLGAIVVGAALAVYDFRWHLLPDRLVKIFAALGVAYAIFFVVGSTLNWHSILSIVCAVLVSGGLFWVLYQVSDGKWIGGGDVKLGFPLGLLLLTPLKAATMLFLASILGCLYAVIITLLGKYKKKAHIPFGPFLLLATYIIVLYGHNILTAYQDLIFP